MFGISSLLGRKVKWAHHFDHVYCIHFTGQPDRLPAITAEFRRVGLLQSGIFDFVYNSPDPWESAIVASCPLISTEPASNAAFVNLGLCTARILREALCRGFSRILILENDIRFFRDLARLERTFAATPDGFDIVQYDKFVEWDLSPEAYRGMVSERRINDFFFDGGTGTFYSGACFALTENGMRALLQALESDGPRPTDGLFGAVGVRRAVADRNAAVQVEYKNALAHLYIGDTESTHMKSYAPQALDFADYGLTSPVVPATAPERPPDAPQPPATKSRNRLFVSVYAISKNESKFVDRWVDSMSEADEIVVLDTGSTDDTVARLRARGVKVTERRIDPWRFDIARNESMKLVSPEAAILVCTDLDEILRPGWRTRLVKAWVDFTIDNRRPPTTAQYEYVWSFNADGSDGHKFMYEKVHAPGVALWCHPVHEVLDYGGREKRTVTVPGMRLEHHADPMKSRAQYLGLLEMSVAEDPEDDRNMHYLGREYMFRGRWEDAIRTLQRHLSLPRAVWKAERAASMRFIARCENALGHPDRALDWFRKAMDEAPDQREPAVELAQFAYDRTIDDAENAQKWWTVVIEGAERALQIAKQDLSYLTESDAWGAKPYDLLSLAYWYTGRKDEARRMLDRAIELSPYDPRLRENRSLMSH